MSEDFSLIYEPQNEYTEIGYHATLNVYKDDIIEKGFKLSHDEDDWLGEGVYFWDDIRNAQWWKKDNGIIPRCIFVCKLKCDRSKYLDLDCKKEMEKFSLFSKQYLKEMAKATGKKPAFKGNNQRKKFFCDIYCSKQNISILSFTFEHDFFNVAGFKEGTLKRRQICVKEPNCISIVSVKE